MKHDVQNEAIELFTSQGYDPTTALRINKAAGETEPATNYHFENKNNLFNRIPIRASTKYTKLLEKIRKSTKM